MADALLVSEGTPVQVTNVLSVQNFDLNQSTDQLEFIFQADEAATITRIGFRLASLLATPNYKASIQGVTGAGIPDGVIKGGVTPASVVFNPTGLALSVDWHWINLDNSLAVARGDMLALVIAYDSGTIDGTHFSGFTSALTGVSSVNFPYAIQNDNGVRTRNGSTSLACFGYGAASKAYGAPFSTPTSVSYSSASGPNEYAVKFTLPAGWGSTFKVAGVRVLAQAAAGGTITIRLYDTDGTSILQDFVWDGDDASTGGAVRNARIFFDEATLSTLSFGSTYRVGFIPNATALVLQFLDTSAAADWDAWPGGQQFSTSSRTGAGAWGEAVTRRLIGELILSDWTAGGGSMGARIFTGF